MRLGGLTIVSVAISMVVAGSPWAQERSGPPAVIEAPSVQPEPIVPEAIVPAAPDSAGAVMSKDDGGASAQKEAGKPAKDAGSQEKSSAMSGMSSSSPGVTLPSQSVLGLAPPQMPKAEYSGTFATKIDIELPAFRGLESRFGLHYDSALGIRAGGFHAGLAGTGWRMPGLSEFVRVGRVHATPQFDSSDVHQIDGLEVIACATGTDAASCLAGGTHYTRIETYLKIAFDDTANEWSVWSKDGARSTYKAVGTWGGTVASGDATPDLITNRFRWLLAEIEDTHGNAVTKSPF